MKYRLLLWVIIPGLIGLIVLPVEGAVPQNQKKIRENISTLMLLRMTAALDLSEEQATKIFPRVNKTEKDKAALNMEMTQAMRRLRVLVNDRNPDEGEIGRMLEKIQTVREQIRLKDEELSAFLDDNLTVLQRGKYVFFQQQFFKDLREQLNRARTIKNKKQPIRKR